MKVTLTQAQMIQAAVAKFTGVNLPVKTSYLLARTVLEITAYLEAFQGERMKLAKKHCQLDERGNPKTEETVPAGMTQLVFKDDKARDAFVAGVSELGNEEVELNLRNKLSLEAFSDPNTEDETVIPWDVLAGLMSIIEEQE